MYKIKYYYVNKSAFFKAHFRFEYKGKSESGSLTFNIDDGYSVTLPTSLKIPQAVGEAICREAVKEFKEGCELN